MITTLMMIPGESIEIQNQIYNETTQDIITVMNDNGCDSIMYTLTIEIEDIEQELFQEYEVNADESTPIRIDYNGSYSSVSWLPEEGLSCSDCIDPEVQITEDIVYNVEIEKANGCIDIIEVSIEVVALPEASDDAYYLPNVINIRTSNNNRFYMQMVVGMEAIMTHQK